MQYEKKVIKIGNSLGVIVPTDLATYLNLEFDSNIIIQDEENKKGQKYASFWKKE